MGLVGYCLAGLIVKMLGAKRMLGKMKWKQHLEDINGNKILANIFSIGSFYIQHFGTEFVLVQQWLDDINFVFHLHYNFQHFDIVVVGFGCSAVSHHFKVYKLKSQNAFRSKFKLVKCDFCRSFVIAASLMFGRLGALSGNMLFPVFVEIGCLPPFLMVGIIMFCK